MANILDGLTDDQIEAAKNISGPLFIVAGPGSGKTRTIISRIAYMIQSGIPASQILIFTFTTKAANEIKQRLQAEIGDESKKVMSGTYHGICNRILRHYAADTKYTSNFSIYDEDDSKSIIKELCKNSSVKYEVAYQYIQTAKAKRLKPSNLIGNSSNSTLTNIYKEYQDVLERANAMDFDDLIDNTLCLLENHPDVLKEVNRKYRYITSDEFHDSTKREVQLIEYLSGDDKNICMILDDDQSIYGFRGADLNAVIGAGDFFNAKICTLHTNFRSTQSIVSASRSLISHNKLQIPKELRADKAGGLKPMYFMEASKDKETDKAMLLIRLLHEKYSIQYKDICILYRMNYLSRSVEMGLIRNAIPYRIVSGLPFFSRKEIKDILSFARFIFNPQDIEAFKRIVNIPKRGIGASTIQKIIDSAQGNDIYSVVKTIELNKKQRNALDEFVKLIDNLVDNMNSMTAGEFINYVMEETNYTSTIDDDEITERTQNIDELISAASEYSSIEDFINQIVSDEEKANDEDKVSLMTMHASKGLEFKAIIIIDVDEGICPHFKAKEQSEIEEERRLLYVAMTRAEEFLFIMYSASMIYKGKFIPYYPSKFMKQIDKSLIHVVDDREK